MTQHTHYELLYDTKQVLLVEFSIPTFRIQRQLEEDLVVALLIKMEDLAQIDKLRWEASDNMDYIQILQKEQRDHGQKLKVFEKGNLVLWMPKDEKIKSGKFRMPWE